MKNYMTDKIKLIKTIYIYLVSFVALMMIVISTVDLLNQTLRAFVFTKADNYNRYAKPIGCEDGMAIVDKTEDAVRAENLDTTKTNTKMTAEKCAQLEKANLEREKQNQIADRQRDFANDIALILVGLPLFYFHWRIARRRD